MSTIGFDLDSLPGAEIVLPGIDDLRDGRDTIEAAAVLLARPRLLGAGLDVPPGPDRDGEPGHHLYDLLVEAATSDPHSRYNAILRRLVSFAGSLELAQPS